MKESLKPCVYKQSERELDGVLFVERSGELRYVARLSYGSSEAEGKPSQKRARSPEGDEESHEVDPKPGDLPVARLKLE